MVRHSLQSQAVRSGKTAKERLIQMMLEEHTQCTPETLSCMEHDITKTISKYLPVSEKNICLYLKRNRDKERNGLSACAREKQDKTCI